MQKIEEMDEMIKERNISMENAILLLKHVGYNKVLKKFFSYSFDYSLLSKKMPGMIIEEERRIEDKNERLLVDLCECFALLNFYFISDELLLIIVPRLLKVASKKEENEETQKEAEMALLALSNANTYYDMPKELYLNEMTEIIKCHQEHHNMTRLAFQSAWQFLINRFFTNISLEEVIMNELHFSKEAARELEDLSKSVDWKRKEEGKGEREVKEVSVIKRWLLVIDDFLNSCTLWNEELTGLIRSIVQMIRASRDNHKEILNGCLDSLRCTAINRNVEIDDLLKSGAVDAVLEEMKQSTLDDFILWNCLDFFLNISKRLKEEEEDEMDETKRKELKREILEKMEEEGYEDFIKSFREMIDFLNRKYYDCLSLNISDYFVSI
ncbi:uncharacterized protein MONOS_4398 [Monocercomonoides exilis]|uniref:uncharacterized protein n=1 Tax=Monocercomonoides exilis TaxID=2049356 RepID=UPI00355A75C4|nr:hypothetical protein MONOS_4398 [Monocercomonoides exilis]|eukprot:MONOS_4398.1-p1 / transcript=MONOS_4398.1 / gene=MONOS_4398 / organism=Monocercomonoides_exilis_PA203 / gene_product=unspecified product / transcript_product=unspecified product / location=Mono_scaffold00117:3150-4359(-) / protein_length=383 / sequence_SO=supercontig / SO=protein_coding / is_pseudo=false